MRNLDDFVAIIPQTICSENTSMWLKFHWICICFGEGTEGRVGQQNYVNTVVIQRLHFLQNVPGWTHSIYHKIYKATYSESILRCRFIEVQCSVLPYRKVMPIKYGRTSIHLSQASLRTRVKCNLMIMNLTFTTV